MNVGTILLVISLGLMIQLGLFSIISFLCPISPRNIAIEDITETLGAYNAINTELKWTSKLASNPPGRLLTIVVTLTIGWPLYLAFNFSGRKYPRFACQYDPYGPIYNNRERLQILVSEITLLILAYALYLFAPAYGLASLIKVYAIPLLIVNGFLVLITYL